MFDDVKENPLIPTYLKFEEEELKGTEFMGTIEFYNGYELSIVKHNSSYGGKKGLFEIALCKGESQICMPPITAEGDTVKGFLTKEQVIEIIETTRDLPGTV
tara:strand:- start:97 stop:402 length:306 start_codon:yes stop_codon:yes gene_type:complete